METSPQPDPDTNLNPLKKGAVVVFEDDITALLTDDVLLNILEKADCNPAHAPIDIDSE